MSGREADIKRFRSQPEEIASYLTDTFKENDLEPILIALNRVVRSQNIIALAQESGMRREGLYKKFGGRVDPHLSTLLTLFEALGIRIKLEAAPGHRRRRVPKSIKSRTKLEAT